MRTLKIVLAYDGAEFVGWQRQPSGVSVQGCLEDALAAVEGQPVSVVGAGRTDAGVHALGQVASCRLSHPLPAATLARALNARLPRGVRVIGVHDAPDDFHARYAARRKTYRYLVLNGPLATPFACRFVWHVEPRLDVEAMACAARLLEGEHDFAALQGTGSATKTTARTVTRAAVFEPPIDSMFGLAFAVPDKASAGRLIVFEITGNGFLRHMVRNAVGTLAEVGLGKRQPGWIAEVLASRDRSRAGATAPASGLFLVDVDYGPR